MLGNGIVRHKRIKLDHYKHYTQKLTQNGLDLSVRPETGKFLEENRPKSSWPWS